MFYPQSAVCWVIDRYFYVCYNTYIHIKHMMKKKKILLIETNAVIAKVYEILFSKEADFEFRLIGDLRSAENGALAFGPDLILLGVHFPADSDLELVKILKQRSEFKEIPIVILGPGHDIVSDKYFKNGIHEMIDVSRLPLKTIIQKIRKYF